MKVYVIILGEILGYESLCYNEILGYESLCYNEILGYVSLAKSLVFWLFLIENHQNFM